MSSPSGTAAELTDQLWYGRKPSHDQPLPEDWLPEIVARVRSAQRQMEEQYGKEALTRNIESDWAWGYLSGKVSAIRWVLEYEWDMLDT